MSDSVVGPEVFQSKLDARQGTGEVPKEKAATCTCGGQIFLLLGPGQIRCVTCDAKINRLVWGNVVERDDESIAFRMGSNGLKEKKD